jgi:Cysteine-rich CPXCG
VVNRRGNNLDVLKRKVTDLDEQVIDELYGLEPVYRPDDITSDRVEPTAFVDVGCPYCAEVYETQVDLTAGSFSYVEDCQICCQPIELFVEVNGAGRLTGVNAQRME